MFGYLIKNLLNFLFSSKVEIFRVSLPRAETLKFRSEVRPSFILFSGGEMRVGKRKGSREK